MTNPRDGRIVFPCGAAYECDHAHWSGAVNRSGRIKLCVLDTANAAKPTPPKTDGVPASCAFGCPARKYRRSQRAMSDGPRPFAWRVVVTCSGVLERWTPTTPVTPNEHDGDAA